MLFLISLKAKLAFHKVINSFKSNILNIMKKILLIALILNFASFAFSQDRKKVKLEGKVIEKPWSKSAQSYCAQGSAYYIIKTKGKEYVLENHTKDKLQQVANQKVIILGYFEEKKIKNNPMEQHPVSAAPVIEQKPVNTPPSKGKTIEKEDVFKCTVFVVENIQMK